MRRVALFVLSLTIAACHQASNGADLALEPADMAEPSDLGASSDFADSDDLSAAGDLANAPPDMSANDLSMMVANDMAQPPDLLMPDLAIVCQPPPGDGMPHVVSGITPTVTSMPMSATDGTTTLILWNADYGSGTNTYWAEVQSGSVSASGTLTPGFILQGINDYRLFAFKSKFYLHDPLGAGLYVFNGSAFTAVSGFSPKWLASGPSVMLGVSAVGGGTSVSFFDGTTATAATKISTNTFGGAGSDGASGFGVVTYDSMKAAYFLTYNGASWSTEASIGTFVGVGNGTIPVAYSGSTWAVADAPQLQAPTAWVLKAGTWTSTNFSTMYSYQPMLVGNAGLVALGSGDGRVTVYDGSSWSTPFQVASGIDHGLLSAYGSGFVFATVYPTLTASIYSGGSWSAPVQLAASINLYATLSVSGTTIAIAYTTGTTTVTPSIATGSSGSWSSTQLTTLASAPAAAVIVGGAVVAAYPEPGTMRLRSGTNGVWGSPSTFSMPGATGAVLDGAIARAPNGDALAVWIQFTSGQNTVYGAKYTGGSWGTPVQLAAKGDTPMVAALGNSFVVGWNAITTLNVGVWTGAAISSPTTFTGVTPMLASDGTNAVLVFTDGNRNLWSSTSTDGTSWSTAQNVEPSGNGWTLLGLVGGPAGVVEWSSVPGVSGTTHQARLAKGGTWSAAVSGSQGSCVGAVSNSDALYACRKSDFAGTSIVLQRFDGVSWGGVTAPSVPMPVGVAMLASDGTDYRIEVEATNQFSQALLYDSVLHGGAWSSAVNESHFSNWTGSLSGSCGWSGAIKTGRAHVSDASAFPALTPLVSGISVDAVNTAQSPGVADALVRAPTATSVNADALYVILDY
jgi:hypothetical protein